MCSIDGGKCSTKDVVEYVVYTCTAREFFRANVDFGTIDRGDEVPCELGHEPEDERALLLGVKMSVKAGKRKEIVYLVFVSENRRVAE